MADRFYVNCPLSVGEVVLQGPEAHHLATVCRVRPGDRVCLFNGDGQQYPAEVREIERRRITLRVLAVEAPQRELGFRLDIAAPLPKGDRVQFLVEKLTELGVTAFVPLRTRRSVVHPRETRLDKLERYVIEASKQCGRNVLMHIGPLTDWETYCRRSDLPPNKVMAHPEGDTETHRRRDAETNEPTAHSGLAVAVGPEGGFTPEEIACAQAAGWRLLHLGPRILRIETAALLLGAWAVCSAEPGKPGN